MFVYIAAVRYTNRQIFNSSTRIVFSIESIIKRVWTFRGFLVNGLKVMTAPKTLPAIGGRVLIMGPRLFRAAVTSVGSLGDVSDD